MFVRHRLGGQIGGLGLLCKRTCYTLSYRRVKPLGSTLIGVPTSNQQPKYAVPLKLSILFGSHIFLWALGFASFVVHICRAQFVPRFVSVTLPASCASQVFSVNQKEREHPGGVGMNSVLPNTLYFGMIESATKRRPIRLYQTKYGISAKRHVEH